MSVFKRLHTGTTAPRHRYQVAIPAPLSGRVRTLDSLAPGLFQQRLFGEGVVIEASGYQLLAPLHAKVSYIADSAEQLRLQCANGLHLLIQVGFASDKLHGAGFKKKCQKGANVAPGQLLLEYDLNRLKTLASPLLCPVTILNSDKVKAIQPHCRSVIAGDDNIMSVFI